MFNVIRTQPGPDCSDYRSKEVITELRNIFYGKCYLCEDEVAEPVVEHFTAHKGNTVLEHDWNNLYYACHRCNGMKASNVDNQNLEILDCCDSSVDVSRSVKCLCPSIPGYEVLVEMQDASDKTKNTAHLLDKCYNEDNTGIRGISKEALHEKLFEAYCKFIACRRTLKDRDSLNSKKDEAREQLTRMTGISYPFSVFWKWHILSDPFLAGQFPGV
jgi:hypothetical protein